MTRRAILGGRNVGGVDLGGLPCRYRAVVARRAIANDTGMVEYRRRKRSAGHVTGAAILASGDVIGLGIFARCIDAIVAGVAPAV